MEMARLAEPTDSEIAAEQQASSEVADPPCLERTLVHDPACTVREQCSARASRGEGRAVLCGIYQRAVLGKVEPTSHDCIASC